LNVEFTLGDQCQISPLFSILRPYKFCTTYRTSHIVFKPI